MWHFHIQTWSYFVTDKTFRKYTTLLCDPKFCRGFHGKASTVGTQLLFRFALLNNSWGFWFDFWCNTIILLVDPTPLLLFCFSTMTFIFRAKIPHAAPSKVHHHIHVDGGDDSTDQDEWLRCAHTYTHTHTARAHTQRAHNLNAPERMKDRVGCFSSFSCIQVDQLHCFCYRGGSGTYHAIGALNRVTGFMIWRISRRHVGTGFSFSQCSPTLHHSLSFLDYCFARWLCSAGLECSHSTWRVNGELANLKQWHDV